ncbi:MAG: tRNA adenosine(34) deaminase TadA [bacterium]|nr:tRNA adenosine(34) deaminase TadA [bacterium]
MNKTKNWDIYFMQEALSEAEKAYKNGDVPVGAVIVLDDKIIARGYNQVEFRNDPTAHAEILAIQQAADYLRNERLLHTTLYVTIEPCTMCAGALVLSRISNLVYGADDPKTGACGSIVNIIQHPCLNHQLNLRKGILEEEAKELIQRFFKERRG